SACRSGSNTRSETLPSSRPSAVAITGRDISSLASRAIAGSMLLALAFRAHAATMRMSRSLQRPPCAVNLRERPWKGSASTAPERLALPRRNAPCPILPPSRPRPASPRQCRSVRMSLSEFAISDAGFWEKTALVALILFVAYLVIMWVAATLWTYRDIQTRSDDRALQAVCVALVAVFSLPGLVLYVLLRPQESLSERFERQLEAEAFMHEIQDEATCPSCRRRVGEQFVRCPYCRAQLASPCEQCGRNLSETWVVCPYC